MKNITHHIRTYFAIFLATFLFTQLAGAAHAATETLQSVRLEPIIVGMIISVVIPVLTGVLSKARWSSGTKGLITLILTMTNTLIVQNTVDDGSAFFNQETLLAFFLNFVIAIAAYYGVYKPNQITSSPVEVDPISKVVEPGKLAKVGIK